MVQKIKDIYKLTDKALKVAKAYANLHNALDVLDLTEYWNQQTEDDLPTLQSDDTYGCASIMVNLIPYMKLKGINSIWSGEFHTFYESPDGLGWTGYSEDDANDIFEDLIIKGYLKRT